MSKRREQIQQRHVQQRKQMTVAAAIIVVAAVILIGGAVILNALSNAPHAIVAVNNPPPANAERNGRAWGPADAPIKVLAFVDAQCPGCGLYTTRFEPGIIAAFAKTGKVRYEVRLMSFIGAESVDAARAALCAMDQDKFWQMHAALFANQWGAENSGNFTRANLQTMASQLGMDTAAFNACIDARKYDTLIQADATEASRLGVHQTPTFAVNGRLVDGVQNVDDFKRVFAQVAPDVHFTQ